ncbi:GNAT family N-acetyltransferase [Microbacterium koreense]|uniref:GNAT family N-acetyltransferase n=1 Tax=Microbacterium koreense TaxID=323761 RepID=A0ABW2ZR04_9MICO
MSSSSLADRHLHGPVDETSRTKLERRDLDYRRLSVDDEGFPAWVRVVRRGFLEDEASDTKVEAIRAAQAYRRISGVYDPTTPIPDQPVATIDSWITDLAVPGDRALPSCAISGVGVSPTHRRRGIARAMLEGELRAAQSIGVPLAMLTVSESTLYGRYGFGVAASSTHWVIDTMRASWTGPRPDGRLDFITPARARELLPVLHERIHPRVPGEIGVAGGVWDEYAGTRADTKNPAKYRAVQYTDTEGEVRGVVVYWTRENNEDWALSSVTVSYLCAETDDAYAALWRFMLELDLVVEVRADQLSVEEPLLWMISDQRAATITVTDHQYVRVIDVPQALEGRRYSASGRLVVDVTDPVGLSTGRWLLDVDGSGEATVTALDDEATVEGAAVVALGIEELSAAYLGGVSIATLASAGRADVSDPALASRIFSWYRAPRLSLEY